MSNHIDFHSKITSSNWKILKYFLFLLGIFILWLTSCIDGDILADRNQVEPLPTLTPGQIVFPELVNPTNQINSPDETEKGQIYDPVLFTHSENLFTLNVSQDWTDESFTHGALFRNSKNDLVMVTEIINTGYVLDDESFENFIDIQEENGSIYGSDFILIANHKLSKENSFLLTKLVPFENKEKIVFTYYQQYRELILKIDYFTEQDLFNADPDIFLKIINSVSINSDAVKVLKLYFVDENDRISNDYYSLTVPTFWREEIFQDEFTILNTFTSPDNQAAIQMLVYDDGKQMSNNIAADFALKLLRDNYAKDIVILKDEILLDGREKLNWRSEGGNYHGDTTFETCDSALFMITVVSTDDFDHIYQNLLNDILDSYQVIVSCQ